MFQDLVALLAGLLVFGWWLADWIRSRCVLSCLHTLDMLDNDILMLHPQYT